MHMHDFGNMFSGPMKVRNDIYIVLLSKCLAIIIFSNISLKIIISNAQILKQPRRVPKYKKWSKCISMSKIFSCELVVILAPIYWSMCTTLHWSVNKYTFTLACLYVYLWISRLFQNRFSCDIEQHLCYTTHIIVCIVCTCILCIRVIVLWIRWNGLYAL
jgi:hypothetical protein